MVTNAADESPSPSSHHRTNRFYLQEDQDRQHVKTRLHLEKPKPGPAAWPTDQATCGRLPSAQFLSAHSTKSAEVFSQLQGTRNPWTLHSWRVHRPGPHLRRVPPWPHYQLCPFYSLNVLVLKTAHRGDAAPPFPFISKNKTNKNL